jgi:hypothetical protein
MNIAQDEIDSLIRAEQDPRTRAMLLVLAKISSTLSANTALTRDIGNKLEEHLERYEAKAATDADLQLRALGAWRVVAWILAAVQVVALSVGGWVVNEVRDLHHVDSAVLERLARVEADRAQEPRK